MEEWKRRRERVRKKQGEGDSEVGERSTKKWNERKKRYQTVSEKRSESGQVKLTDNRESKFEN